MHTTMISTPFGGRERYVSGVGPTWQELSMARLSQKRFLDKWWKDELATVKKSISKDMDNLGPAKYAMGGIPNIENDLKDDWYKVLTCLCLFAGVPSNLRCISRAAQPLPRDMLPALGHGTALHRGTSVAAKARQESSPPFGINPSAACMHAACYIVSGALSAFDVVGAVGSRRVHPPSVQTRQV